MSHSGPHCSLTALVSSASWTLCCSQVLTNFSPSGQPAVGQHYLRVALTIAYRIILDPSGCHFNPKIIKMDKTTRIDLLEHTSSNAPQEGSLTRAPSICGKGTRTCPASAQALQAVLPLRATQWIPALKQLLPHDKRLSTQELVRLAPQKHSHDDTANRNALSASGLPPRTLTANRDEESSLASKVQGEAVAHVHGGKTRWLSPNPYKQNAQSRRTTEINAPQTPESQQKPIQVSSSVGSLESVSIHPSWSDDDEWLWVDVRNSGLPVIVERGL